MIRGVPRHAELTQRLKRTPRSCCRNAGTRQTMGYVLAPGQDRSAAKPILGYEPLSFDTAILQ